MEDLKDPLIGNMIFTRQVSDAFASGVTSADLGIALCFGNVFERDRFIRERNTGVEAVKHPRDSTIEGGYGCGSKARLNY